MSDKEIIEFELRNIKLQTTKGTILVDGNICLKFKETFTRTRGEIIEQSMAILNEIKRCLELFSVSTSTNEPGEDFMTLRDRLSDELKKRPEFKSSTKKLRSNLYWAIKMRDIYAHADLGFNNDVPFIKYEERENNQIEEISKTISEEALKKDLSFIKKVKEDMRSLTTLILTKQKQGIV